MADAFAHHVWATVRLIDTCLELSPLQLETDVPGTYGSILATMRHLVGADAWYLFVASGDRGHVIDEEQAELDGLRASMERQGAAWSRLLGEGLDPDAILLEVDDADGFERRAPVGIQLAQALHHGTDHRSQVCTALSTLGVAAPDIDVWAFGLQAGRTEEKEPQS